VNDELLINDVNAHRHLRTARKVIQVVPPAPMPSSVTDKPGRTSRHALIRSGLPDLPSIRMYAGQVPVWT
jgi:hypothetical protein